MQLTFMIVSMYFDFDSCVHDRDLNVNNNWTRNIFHSLFFFKSTNGTDFLETFYRYDRRQI